MTRNQRVKNVLLGLFLVLAMVLVSCAPMAMEMRTGPKAWVGGPRDGTEVPAGEVPVLCHGFARVGVSQVELLVNDSFVTRAANTEDPGATDFTAILAFQAAEPGRYAVRCRVVDQDGEMGTSAPITVVVPGEVPPPPPPPEETATPTETTEPPTATPLPPTGTPVPPTATPIPPTATPIPPTATPLPPTPTPLPPNIVSLVASPSTIVEGQCTTVSWQVQGFISAVFFDGEGVGHDDSRQKCPTQTTSYQLVAQGPGGQTTANVTVSVTPGDTTGPQIYRETGPKVMAAPNPPYCTSPYEFGAIVTDPSGVRWVKLICSFNQGPEQTCGGLQFEGSNFYSIEYALPTDDSAEPGDSMRWYIRACDMVDPMNCSNSPSHTVPIGECLI